MKDSAGVTVTETGGQLKVTGTTDSTTQFGTFGIRSVASFTSDFLVESRFSIVSQSATAHAAWKGYFGLGNRLAVDSDNSTDKKVRYWTGTAWVDVGDSTLDAATFSNQRITQTYTADGTARHLENGTLTATRTGLAVVTDTLDLRYGPDKASETFDVRFDDVIVRKYVSPEPTAVLACHQHGPRWWDRAFGYRRPVTITADTSAVPAGYAVAVSIDHAAMVAAGTSLAGDDDLRTVWWNGSGWTELDRVLDLGSAWNTTATKLWVRVPAALAATGTDNRRYLYHGHSQAGPPRADPDGVWDIWDDFADGVIDTAKWLVRTQGTVTVAESGGQLKVSGTTDSATQYDAFGIDSVASFTSDFLLESRFSIVSQSSAAHAAWKGYFGLGNRLAVDSDSSTDKKVRYWNGTAWVDVGDSTLDAATFSNQRITQTVTADGTARHLENGTLMASRGLTVESKPVRLRYGPDRASETFDIRFDDIIVRKYVASEPTTAVGAAEARP